LKRQTDCPPNSVGTEQVSVPFIRQTKQRMNTDIEPSESDPNVKPGGPSTGKLILFAAIVIALFVATRFLPIQAWWTSLSEWIDSLGYLGPLVFVAMYVFASVAFIPGSVLTLGAAAVFGFGWGLLWVIVGSNIGANLAFLIGRYFARDAITKQIEGNQRFEAIDRAVESEGWKIVGLTRLSPAFPFNLLNYAFGLTNVRWIEYSVATLIGMLPGTIMYVYIGSLGKLAAESDKTSAAQIALTIVGLLATIAVTVLITRKARQALNDKAGLEQVSN
jgi:uncharacterized membrane protein YdjX (TVP38/TMEM64 family)